MLTLKVSGMTCGGRINAVTRAIRAEVRQAKLQADLKTQTINLETSLPIERAT